MDAVLTAYAVVVAELLLVVCHQDAILLPVYQQVVAWVDAVLIAYAVVVVELLIYVFKTLMHVVSLVIADIAVLHVIAVHAVHAVLHVIAVHAVHAVLHVIAVHAVHAVLAVHVALAVHVDQECRDSRFLKEKWEEILSTELLIVEQNLPKQ